MTKKFCRYDYVKDLEMRLSWIIQVDPKCNHDYPSKVEAKGYLITGEWEVTLEAEIGVM